MPKFNLSRLISFPNIQINQIKSRDRFIFIHCETTNERPHCLFCDESGPRIHQYHYRKVKESLIRGRLPILTVKMKRYKCRKCHKTFNEKLPGILPYKRLTERMQREIYWSCENFSDLKKVRKHTSCGSKTIYERYYKQLQLKQRMRDNTPWPKTIGIDEHAFTKNKKRGHRDFVTLIVDYNNSKPRELLPTKNSAELQKMLQHIPGRENVKNVAMDLSGSYRSFAKSFFPNAKIIADHFHVVRLMHPAINRMRKEITGDQRKHPLRKMLLKNGFNLKVFERKAIHRWLDSYPQLKEVYMAKEALHRLYRCRGTKKARQCLIKILDWLALSNLKELKRLRKTLMSWKDEILNYFENRITNAKTEGFNNVAKSIILKYLKFFGIKSIAPGQNRNRMRGLGYGIKNDGIHKREKENIQKMKNFRAKGYSYEKIANIFNTMKIPTKTRRGKWHRKTINQILNSLEHSLK